jgi:5-formyltetrahydrofolate cyclo-ligase
MKDWIEIKAWRKARRQELIAERAAISPGRRHAWSDRITSALVAALPVSSGAVVGFCWPHKGEFDARFAVRHWRERGALAALPAVVEKTGPLQFRLWWPGAPMRKGVFDIPVPDGTEVVAPDIAIVPMNGFDGQGYRLGYGGGYFDRTLAALGRRVLAVGVAFEALRLDTIHPQPHDIPMDFVVTEAGIYRAGGRNLALIDGAACGGEARSLMESRGLPRPGANLSAAWAGPAGGGYSSPACYAHEVPPEYFGESRTMPDEELIGLLNTLLEAERAGARVIAEFLDDYERDAPEWKQLAAVQRDEARNCAILIDLLRRVKGAPSTATGDFVGKALAVKGRIPRLQFLNRGQLWVARQIGEALPRIRQAAVRDALSAMHDSHLLNIEACDALVEVLSGRTGNHES